MKKEIEQLIEEYRNQQTSDATKTAEFGKGRQRAELLKQNDVFLTDLSWIKKRLGERFFKLLEHEIPELGLGNPEKIDHIGPIIFTKICRDLVLNSDFAEPAVILERELLDICGQPFSVYYLPGTPILDDGWPEHEIDTGSISLPPYWVIIKDTDPEYKEIGTPEFEAKCKEKVFAKYVSEWGSFLATWHISVNWRGELETLYVHSLPSVIVELDKRSRVLPVVIRLGAWATREDVGNAWALVQEKMKEARVYREHRSDNFLRDQIWYKQYLDLSMSPLDIAREWARLFAHEVDIEALAWVVKNDDEFDEEDTEGLLKEIFSDDSMSELKGRFIEGRKAYVNTVLNDKVRKTINKTKVRIERLGLPQ